MYRYFFKRLLDLGLAIFLFVLSLPLFMLLLVVLSIYYKGSPFFYQERPGYKGRSFYVIKFKSMIDAFGKDGTPLPDIERITKVGIFLRKTSLDELPQLLNVLKGDMSFIGPRPLLMRYLPYYSEREFRRHDVRPGITGLAQINGRNYLIWKDRLELDVQYVENLSLKLDMQILIKTIIKVMKGSDVNVVPNGKPFDVYRQGEQPNMAGRSPEVI